MNIQAYIYVCLYKDTYTHTYILDIYIYPIYMYVYIVITDRSVSFYQIETRLTQTPIQASNPSATRSQ